MDDQPKRVTENYMQYMHEGDISSKWIDPKQNSNLKSVTKIASSQKNFIFLSPERAATYKPRATPWVNGRLVFSPERALHKKSDKTCNALSGLLCCQKI